MDKKLRDKIVREIVDEVRSSQVRSSDADWYIGFKPEAETPVEGKAVTYLQHWDADNTGYVEETDQAPKDNVHRDSGTYSFRMWKSLFKK